MVDRCTLDQRHHCQYDALLGTTKTTPNITNISRFANKDTVSMFRSASRLRVNLPLLIFSSIFISLLSLSIGATDDTTPEGKHAIAMHGAPKYPANFSHFAYVNPQAPKGGELVLSDIGAFDSLNPFVMKGMSAAYINTLSLDTLTVSSSDESFSQYGLIAERIVLAPDRSSVTFYLNPKARFQDSSPILAADVKFSFELLINKGSPFFAAYYGDVERVSVDDKRKVTFHFKHNRNRELPLILGQMPVLSQKGMEGRVFDENLLQPLPASGPYRITDVRVGQSITYQRDENYWAKDHPVNRGRFNFDRIRVDYYRDQNVALEAFKSGAFDFQAENSARRWAELYRGRAFDSGQLLKAEIPHSNPAGMQAFVVNTRRAMFSDARVRQALNYAFDYEWTNRNLFHDAYTRSNSFFSNSELAARELPSKQELALLTPFKNQLPQEVFSQVYNAPVSDGSGNIRAQLRKASELLREAGWQVTNKRLVRADNQAPFEFEILLVSRDFERIVLPFTKNLERLGIKANVRVVDQSEYINRVREFSFDMIIHTFRQSDSPGNEQRDYWYSGFADRSGSQNLIGVKDPVVDKLIEHIINAKDRPTLVAACRALDRVLLWNHYVIPQWHINSYRIAYSSKLAQPDVQPEHDIGLFNWWVRNRD